MNNLIRFCYRIYRSTSLISWFLAMKMNKKKNLVWFRWLQITLTTDTVKRFISKEQSFQDSKLIKKVILAQHSLNLRNHSTRFAEMQHTVLKFWRYFFKKIRFLKICLKKTKIGCCSFQENFWLFMFNIKWISNFKFQKRQFFTTM